MIVVIIAFSFSIYYVLLLSRISHGWSQYKKVSYSSKGNFISTTILIPFRNEEKNLERNWMSIERHIANTRDSILYINDHSSDKGASIIEKLISNQDNVSLIHLPKGITGKKEALKLGIETAKTQWVITTDADCIYPKNWLETMKAYVVSKRLRMGVGPVVLSHKEKFFAKFQALEYAGLMTMGAANLKLGKANTCSGANLLYHKQSFYDVNGFEGNEEIPSGDDEFLMHKFFLKDPSSVGFVYDNSGLVLAKPEKSIGSFIQQRVRWAGKGNAYQVKEMRRNQIFLALYFILFWISFGMAFYGDPLVQFSCALLFGSKLVFDYLILSKSAYFFKVNTLLTYLPIGVLIQFIYVPIVGILSLFSKGKWKGR